MTLIVNHESMKNEMLWNEYLDSKLLYWTSRVFVIDFLSYIKINEYYSESLGDEIYVFQVKSNLEFYGS